MKAKKKNFKNNSNYLNQMAMKLESFKIIDKKSNMNYEIIHHTIDCIIIKNNNWGEKNDIINNNVINSSKKDNIITNINIEENNIINRNKIETSEVSIKEKIKDKEFNNKFIETSKQNKTIKWKYSKEIPENSFVMKILKLLILTKL